MLIKVILIKVDSLRHVGVFLDNKLHLDYHDDTMTNKSCDMHELVTESAVDF